MLLAVLERYSDAALMLGERQLLLSVIGFFGVFCLSVFWRRCSSASRLSAWLFFLLWNEARSQKQKSPLFSGLFDVIGR